MRLSDYLVDEADGNNILNIGHSSHATTLRNAIAKRKLEVEKDAKINPKLDDSNFKKDIRYRLGQIEMAEWVEDLIQAVKQKEEGIA